MSPTPCGPTVAGAEQHPGWHALRTIAGRITTPLLPDDYLKLANPLWSARELRGRVLEVRRRDRGLRDSGHQAGLGLLVRLPARPVRRHRRAVDGRWRWRSYSLTSSPVRSPAGGPRTITITVKAMPEGFLSTPPGRRGGTGHDRAAGRAAGQFRDARPGARVGAVHHRRVGDHPGDVDAAHAGRGATRSPISSTCIPRQRNPT